MKKNIKKFWQDLVYTNGKLDEKKVMNELSDFYFIMQEVPKVYCEITGGMLSKLMYRAESVLSLFEDLHYDKGITQDDVTEMVKNCDSLKELKKELKDYFNL